MNKCILVITDRTDCNWIDEAVRITGDCHYDVLTLGLSNEGVLYACKDKFNRIKSFSIIDINKYAEAAQEKIRKFIPELIYEFPRKTVHGKSILKLFHFKNINFWWFNKMSEKGAWGTPLIKRMYYLELIRNVVLSQEYQEIWAEINDISLLKLLKNNQDRLCTIKTIGNYRREKSLIVNFWLALHINIFLLQGYYLCMYILLRLLGFRKTIKIREHSILFFTFYPYFWSRYAKGGMTENFFQSLPERINEHQPTYYIAWFTLGLRYILSKHKELKNNFKNKNIVPFELNLHIKDFPAMFISSLLYVLMVLKYRLGMEKNIKELYEGFDITNIILDEFRQSLVNREIIDCILIAKACRRTVEQSKANALIYRVEFQPFERALIYGAKEQCPTIALQHQALARNHLQYFFPAKEISSYYKDRNNPDNLPLSEHYLLTGEYPFEVLKNSGFPQSALDICGPVRYAKLIQYIKKRGTKDEIRKMYGYTEKEKVFLIASPVTREDVFSLMLSLSIAMETIDEDILFLFKSHPVVKYDHEIIEIINKIVPSMKYRILPDEINLNEFLSLSDALILTGTTVGIEAICLGVVPILFENNSSFSLNPLLEIRDSCLCVRNAPELKQAILSVINDAVEVKEVRKNWPSAIKKLFHSIDEDPNLRFIEILSNYGLLKI